MLGSGRQRLVQNCCAIINKQQGPVHATIRRCFGMASLLLPRSCQISRRLIPMHPKYPIYIGIPGIRVQSFSTPDTGTAVTDDPPPCLECGSKYVYYDGSTLFICPSCSYEWEADGEENISSVDSLESDVVRDCHGQVLVDGDDVILTKDLKVKGAQKTLKKGYKMRKIKVRDGGAGHDIECEGILLKSKFLKKA